LNELSLNGLQWIELFEIIDVFAIMFRSVAAHETILLSDETISGFRADIRKQGMVITAATNGGQRRNPHPETVKCEI
jgi:hypothetical protein